jgi:hypothetical protein
MVITGEGNMARKKQQDTNPRVEAETIEEFLARGGVIQKIPYGQRSDVETTGWRGPKRKKAAAVELDEED